MIEPLHTGTVGGKPLRFFRSPLTDRRPDLPWHSVDDLQRCLGLNREQRRIMLAKFRNGPYASTTRTVATADGLVIIAAHFMAQGAVDALVDDGMAPKTARVEYELAGEEALRKLVAHIPFGIDAWFDWMKAAMHRWDHDDDLAS